MKFINWERKGNFKKGFLNIKTIQYLVSGTKHNICSLYRFMIKESNIECFCCKFVKRDRKAHLELQGTLVIYTKTVFCPERALVRLTRILF